MIELDAKLPEIDNFEQLFVQDTPMMDVRAPIEFDDGAFPSAINRPLMDNSERERVGIRYKEQGQDAAIELGIELVSNETKGQRIEAWKQFINENPGGILYCFRGGLRSKITQQWIKDELDITVPRIKGGYKALRNYLIEQLKISASEIKPIVIGGKTGSGKTLFIQKFDKTIDLEKLAWHRGSAFGKHATPQPAQIDFENALSVELLKFRHKNQFHLLFEDESRNIGSKHIPDYFFPCMENAPVVQLEVALEQRINITFDEYITESLSEYKVLHGEDAGFSAWTEQLTNSMYRIRKRLGGVNYVKVNNMLNNAINTHRETGNTSHHRDWIEFLLTDYYDSMYSYQLSKKKHRIVFSGNENEVIDFLSTEYDIQANS